MTNYEINFKKIVQYTEGFTLNIVDVPLSQVYQDLYEPHNVSVIIDPEWKETNFSTIKDNKDSIWLFSTSKRDKIIDELRSRQFLD